ncbi:MAG: L,D-transpeptidase family protein [Pseudomonadota bacterium]
MTLTPRAEDLVVDRWGARLLGRRFPCALGRGGVTAGKREGDGATPAGVLRLTEILWRADRLPHPFGGAPGPLPARPIGPGDIWSDDPQDPAYNRGLRDLWHPFGHERLRRGDPMYDLVAVTDHNTTGVPGAGSAIFLHVHRKPRHPTAGCIAFSRETLLWILRRWRPWSRVIVRGGTAQP